MKNYLRILFILSLLMIFNNLSSQVTVGLDEAPAKAGILQLKNQEADANNVTSTKGGFILSRVALKSLSTLEPFISTSDSDYNSQKNLHIGLLVYNVLSSVDTNDSSITIYPGVYVWNGSKWEKLEL